MQERVQVALAVLDAAARYPNGVVDEATRVVTEALGGEHEASRPRGDILSVRVSESNGNGPDAAHLFTIEQRYENGIHVHLVYTAAQYAKLKSAMLAIEAQPGPVPIVRPVIIRNVEAVNLMLDEHGVGHGSIYVLDPHTSDVGCGLLVQAITLKKTDEKLASIALVDPDIVPWTSSRERR